MGASTTRTLRGSVGDLVVHEWPAPPEPHWVAVLAHGYGEHLGRYDHVAAHLSDDGAVVLGPDHQGHGLSSGERVLVEDFDAVVDDLQLVVASAREEHPGLPVVLVGHSMGGMIATRHAQRFGDELAMLVLSGPVLGSWAATTLADLPEIPETPIDTSTLSRDPAVGEAYTADPLVWHGSFRRETLLALRGMLTTIGTGPSLGDLPTLWMHGEADELVPIGPTRQGLAHVAGSDLTEIVWPEARHEIFNETNQAEVLAALTELVRARLGV